MKHQGIDLRIAIIGTGHVGAAIARGLMGKGHVITLGARAPDARPVLALPTTATACSRK